MQTAFSTLALLFTPTALPQEGPADILAVVPENAVLVLATDELDSIRERASDNRWVQFLQDDEWTSLREMIPVEKMMAEIIDEEDQEWLDPFGMLAATHGRIAVFLSATGEELNPGGGILVEPGEDSEAFLEIYDRAISKIDDDPETSFDSYNEVDLRLFADGSDEVGVVFEAHGVIALLGAEDREALLEMTHGVIDRLRGEDESEGFAGTGVVERARKGRAGDPAISCYIVMQELLTAVGAWEEPDETEEVMLTVGFKSIEWIHLSADLGKGEDLDLRFDIHLPQSTLIGQFMDLMRPAPAEMLKLLPADSLSVGLFNYDIWGAFELFSGFLNESFPEQYEQMQAGLEMASAESGVDIEEDLLQQFTGRFANFSMPLAAEEVAASSPMVDLEEDSALNQGGAVLVGLKDAALVEDVVDRALEFFQVAPMVDSEEFQGTRIQKFEIGGVMAFHWAFTDDLFVYSLFPTPIRSVIRQAGVEEGPSAADNKQFAKAFEPIRDASIVTLTETRSSMEAGLGFLEILGDLMLDELLLEGQIDSTAVTWPTPELARNYFKGTLIVSVERDGDALEVHFAAR